MLSTDGFMPLFHKIESLLSQKERIVIAIDGNSAAGKSTLASLLKNTYPCNVIPTDDFFLRPHQRTPERLAEPGGNIDYERFCDEITDKLRTGAPFEYRPYDCRTQDMSGPVTIIPKPLTVIDGVYSMHPRFAGIYDISAFLRLDPAKQLRRISERDPHLYARFIDEWIPMESSYFETFSIRESCDFTFSC